MRRASVRCARLVAAVVGLGALVGPGPGPVAGVREAAAFECTVTDKNDFVSIRWREVPVRYAVRAPGPRRVDLEVARDAIALAFGAWRSPRCTHMDFTDEGVVDEDTPLPDVSQVIFVSEDWPHASDAVGLTTMTYSTIDGTIAHGKIEVNEAQFDFVDVVQGCGDRADAFDLAAVLTHEVGHFIGLAHATPASGVDLEGPGAVTMSARVVACDGAYRSLETDDQDGLCFIYPAGQRARSCDSLPAQNTPYVRNRPFECAATHVVGDERRGSALAGLGLLALGLARARRRRRSPRPPRPIGRGRGARVGSCGSKACPSGRSGR